MIHASGSCFPCCGSLVPHPHNMHTHEFQNHFLKQVTVFLLSCSWLVPVTFLHHKRRRPLWFQFLLLDLLLLRVNTSYLQTNKTKSVCHSSVNTSVVKLQIWFLRGLWTTSVNVGIIQRTFISALIEQRSGVISIQSELNVLIKPVNMIWFFYAASSTIHIIFWNRNVQGFIVFGQNKLYTSCSVFAIFKEKYF